MLIFVHVPKTAGTTLQHILRRSFGPRHCYAMVWQRLLDRDEVDIAPARLLTTEDIKRIKIVYPNLESIAGHRNLAWSDLSSIPGVRFYTLLREPTVRTVSEYQHIYISNKGAEPFSDWIVKEKWRNTQCQTICGKADADAAIAMIKNRFGFVGIQECFDESLILLRKWINHPDLDIRYKSENRAKSDAVKKNILSDPENLNLLRQANTEDLKLYNYVKNELFPAEISTYGKYFTEDIKKFKLENKDFSGDDSIRSKLHRRLYNALLPLLCPGTLIRH